MVGDMEVRGRYEAYGHEIEHLDREINRLRLRVRMGSDNWRIDLEQLANHAEHRRALDAQRQALSRVLAPDSSQGASAPQPG